MLETDTDLERLQRLLDDSYRSAGPHLREVITEERCLTARELVDRLSGMRLLALATATSDGRPIVGPVDGIFYRGAFYFGSSPNSLRFRHIRRRPDVSATHLPSETLSVTVHGTAAMIDTRTEDGGRFRRTLLDIYVPRYGPGWEDFLDSGPRYARIDAARLFTFHIPED